MAPAAAEAYRETIRLYRQELDRDSQNGHLRCALGRALWASGEIRAALFELREAARLRPSDAEVLAELGEALQETDDDEARVWFGRAADCQRALTLANPSHARHHARLGELLSAACLEGDWDAWYDAALIDPDLPDVLDALCCDQDGEIEVAFIDAARQLKAGRWNAARQAFEKVIDERPVHSGALCGLGMSARQLGSMTMARQAFERASALRPNWQRPRRALADLEGSVD